MLQIEFMLAPPPLFSPPPGLSLPGPHVEGRKESTASSSCGAPWEALLVAHVVYTLALVATWSYGFSVAGLFSWRGPLVTCCVQILGPRNERGRNLWHLSWNITSSLMAQLDAGYVCPCLTSELFICRPVTGSGVVDRASFYSMHFGGTPLSLPRDLGGISRVCVPTQCVLRFYPPTVKPLDIRAASTLRSGSVSRNRLW
jgi:hypothetical protein